ncbi:MAG: hypothetical protein ACREFY_15440, partial [Acetobacteraceae bacterium]
MVLVLLLGACVLSGAAVLRGAEYDEAYSLFVVAGTPRPDWPAGAFPAGRVHAVLAGSAGPARIAAELRATDVHPPLYFWALAAWRRLAGRGLRAARMLSVLAALAALATVGAIATAAGVPAALAMAFTLGCYGFVYTGAIARNFALAEVLALGGTWLALRGAPAPGRRALPPRLAAAGLLLGAASFTNYLAAFVGAAVLAGLAASAFRRNRGPCRPPLTHDEWVNLGRHDGRLAHGRPLSPLGNPVRDTNRPKCRKLRLFGRLVHPDSARFRVCRARGWVVAARKPQERHVYRRTTAISA